MYYSISALDLHGQTRLTKAQDDYLESLGTYEADVFINMFTTDVVYRVIPGLMRGDTLWLEEMGDYRNNGICFWEGNSAVPIQYLDESDYGVPPFYVGDEFPVDHFEAAYCNFALIDIDRHREELISNMTPLYTIFNDIKIYIVTNDPYKAYMALIDILTNKDMYHFRVDLVHGSLAYYTLYNDSTDTVEQLERLGCSNIQQDDSDNYTLEFGSRTLSYVIGYDELIYDASLVDVIDL